MSNDYKNSIEKINSSLEKFRSQFDHQYDSHAKTEYGMIGSLVSEIRRYLIMYRTQYSRPYSESTNSLIKELINLLNQAKDIRDQMKSSERTFHRLPFHITSIGFKESGSSITYFFRGFDEENGNNIKAVLSNAKLLIDNPNNLLYSTVLLDGY
ncbi:MAG: hypothetical protein MJ201_01420 [Mycoplasmoidaceae bacterium]|nr:hypothetical protein [Mycoplasmoidaceae bacterium]